MYLYLLRVMMENALLLHEVSRLSGSILLEGTEDRECVKPTLSSNCHDRFVPKVFVCNKPSATAGELRIESKMFSVYNSVSRSVIHFLMYKLYSFSVDKNYFILTFSCNSL